MNNKGFYFNLCGVLMEYHTANTKYYNIIRKDWNVERKPFSYNVAFVNKLIAEGKAVYIVSRAPSKEAVEGRKEWVKKYLPDIPDENILISTDNKISLAYITTTQAVLFDDDEKTCKQWKHAGYEVVQLMTKGQCIAREM